MAHKAASDLLPPASDLLPDLELAPANDDTLDRVSRVHRRDALPDHINITKSSLPRLVCPPGKKEVFFWDKDIPGLALRAYPSGRRVWICQYRDQHGRTRRVPLGSVAVIDPAAARERARETLRAVANGGNPALDRKAARQAATVGSLVDAYLQDAARRLKPNTLDQSQRNLRKYAGSLHSDAIAIIDRAALFKLGNKLAKDAGEVQANRVLATLSAMWTWGLKAGLVRGENPAAFVPRFPETTRERVLSEGEIQALWHVTASGKTFDRIVRLILLTGCRRQEVGSMEWCEIDGDLWTIPGSRMKGGQVHEVPLSALARAQLPPKADGAVFGAFDGWTAAKRRLDEAIAALRSDAPALPWGLHDLRRTFSTMMNEHGLAEPHIIEACLAHTGFKSGVAGVYNRAAYREAKRAALEAWAALVSEIAGGSDEARTTID
jgi:integrase